MSLSYQGVENLYKSYVARDCTGYACSRKSSEHTGLRFTKSNSVLRIHNFTPFEV